MNDPPIASTTYSQNAGREAFDTRAAGRVWRRRATRSSRVGPAAGTAIRGVGGRTGGL